MAQCVAAGCTKTVRSGSRFPMHRAEYLSEGVDVGEEER